MAISLGGYDLLVPTPELSAWLDRYLPTANLEIFTKPVSIGPRADSVSSTPARVNLGLPNYTAPSPQVCINRLYWPTGASRWSHFFGLCDKSTLASLLGASGTYTLKLTDESRSSPVTIETAMYMLPPRMIPATMDPAAADELWLLPLVDVRYWWQFANSGNVTVTAGSTTWSTAMQAMATALSATLTIDTVDSAYLKPDPVECARDYENPAVLLDAMAHSVGQRVLRELDGTLASKDFASRPGPGDTNLATSGTTYEIVAGGDFSDKAPWLATPAAIKVIFPEYLSKVASCALHVQSKTPTGSGSSRATSVYTKTFRSTCAALVTSAGATPSNNTELSTLAAKIVSDFEASLKFYDYTFAGLKSWQMTTHDDAVEWHMASLGDGGYRAQTRVRSAPYNFGIEEMLHQQDTEVCQWSGVLFGNPSSTITAGATGDVVVRDSDGSDSGITIKATNMMASATVDATTRVAMTYSEKHCRFEIHAQECA